VLDDGGLVVVASAGRGGGDESAFACVVDDELSASGRKRLASAMVSSMAWSQWHSSYTALSSSSATDVSLHVCTVPAVASASASGVDDGFSVA
jgi:hypothetical protein